MRKKWMACPLSSPWRALNTECWCKLFMVTIRMGPTSVFEYNQDMWILRSQYEEKLLEESSISSQKIQTTLKTSVKCHIHWTAVAWTENIRLKAVVTKSKKLLLGKFLLHKVTPEVQPLTRHCDRNNSPPEISSHHKSEFPNSNVLPRISPKWTLAIHQLQLKMCLN